MRLFALMILLLVVASCSRDGFDGNEIYTMNGGGTEDLAPLIEQVSDLKVYFGHQSVGFNILGGVEAWNRESGASLEVIESRDFSSVSAVPFVHFRIGSNGDFRGKVDDFVTLMQQVPVGENPVAFFKFCYVDVTAETDVKAEYEYYREKMLYLKDKYPTIRFIACTVPYTAVQTGVKATVKKVVGKVPYGYQDNVKRQEFNQRVLSDFKGIMPVFDLGGLESTRPDGSIETYSFNGETYPCMPDIYRTDYGHLNDFGARTISFNLLEFLAKEV